MKKTTRKIIQSISITILIVLVNMISSPVPALAESVSDTYANSTYINGNASSNYQILNGSVKLLPDSNGRWTMDEAATNNTIADTSGYGYDPNVATNLVGWWKMDEASAGTCSDGKDVCDSSGNGNHGKANNTTINTSGKYGNARNVNSSTITITNTAALNPPAITMEMWVKRNGGATDNAILYKWSSDSPNQGYGFVIFGQTQGGKIGCWVGGGSWVLSPAAINDNVWHHVACTSSGSSTILYVDGVAGTPVAQTASLTYAMNLNIGWYDTSILDDVRIYNTALTATQIQADMNYIRNGIYENGLVNYWDLNESSGTTAANPIGNNTGTLYGAGGAATGGTITNWNGYTIHAFTTAGDSTFAVNTPMTVQVLTVAGGGGGGARWNCGTGGGGGAGGLVYNAAYSASGNIPVTVGGTSALAANGNNSVFGTITAIGGGAGAYQHWNTAYNGNDGGSGGGSTSGNSPPGIGGAGTSGQGNKGGNSTSCATYCAIGGGGGAGAAAADAACNTSTNGGNGLDYSSIFGTTYGDSGWFAGGGGATSTGGKGGGGGAGVSGTANTGGGGGGGTSDVPNGGTTGGSGIVLVRYQTPSTIVTGKYGNARSFDGASDYFTAPSLNYTSEPFTISMWINPTNISNNPVLFSNGQYNTNGYYVHLLSDGGLTFRTNQAGAHQDTSAAAGTFTTDSWQLLTITRDGSNVKIYKNGIDVTSSAGTHINPATTTQLFTVGTYGPNPATWYYNGKVDEIRIYNYALTAASVLELTNKSIFGPQIVAGQSGNARDFDGANDYATIPSNSTLRPANNFSVEAWVNVDDCNDNRSIIKHADDGGGDDSWTLRISNNCKVQFIASNANGFAAQSLESTETITPGTWYHVAGVYTSDKILKTYVNGAAPTTKQAAGDVVYGDTSNVIIGRRGGSFAPNTFYFKGLIDDVRFYNYARSDAQIAADATGGYANFRPTGTITSTNLLSGATGVDGIDEFTYTLSSLPAGTTATVQFSNDANAGGAMATGGTITYSGIYTIHTFTSDGTFTPETNINAEVLMVGGGGGGGGIIGGGGGGGGVLYYANDSITTGAKPVVIGQGGQGGVGWNYTPQNGTNGGNTTFNGHTALGGGGGAGHGNGLAGDAGTGGGSAAFDTGAGTGTSGQGYNGGTSADNSNYGGGGGGAGSVGGNGASNIGGNGGSGYSSSISGSSVKYGGGGGAGARTGYTAGTGTDGGGNGRNTDATKADDGATNRGGGGGGGGYASGTNAVRGGTGGSGIVIIRYVSSSPTNWYNSSGVLGGTDTLSAGTHSINIHNLTWSGSNFYYRIVLTSNGTSTPVLDSIGMSYTTGGYNKTDTSITDTFRPVTSSTGLSYGVNKVQLSYSGEEGDGIDGAITVGANSSINAANLITGRSCTDIGGTGGDAPYYNVSALTSTTATLTTSPSSGCLMPGDEIVLINLQGGSSSTITNVGNYETLKIGSISGNTITFATSKTKYYGDGANDDTNIGIGATNQKVMIQRVPHYSNVTVSAGYNLYPDAYNYATGVGGVLFFRANGTVSVPSTATINANAKGYKGGTGGTVNTNGAAGQGYPGHSLFYTTGTEGLGGAYASAGNNGTYSGGGGTGGSITSNGGIGTNNVGAGGGGGGGAVYQASGCGGRSGGGGGGGFASGGGGGASGATNGNGTNGDTSNSGTGGKGGGACSGINLSGAGGGGAGNYGLANLTKLNFGSGGGGAGGAGSTVGTGGNGGGIIQIYGSTITIAGSITSTGGSGNNGTGGYWCGCGGGGAGGAIKLVGGSVTLGNNLVTAAGGDGGAAGLCSTYQYGGTGGNGRIAVGGSSVSGSTTPAKTDISALSIGTYATSGSFISTNKLSGISGISRINSFDYTLATKPANTTATVQFSQDALNWYNSSGTANGTDSLSAGSNSISLTGLNWAGPYFYYKINFTSDGSGTPSLTAASVNYTTLTSSASSSWAACKPLPNNNWIIGQNCYFPKTAFTSPERNIDGVDNGNLTVQAYKTLTIKGDQIIVRNNGKQINVQGSIAVNDIPIGGRGGNVRDYSGNNNEGNAIETTVITGKYGTARYFNGTSNYINIPYRTDFPLNFERTNSFGVSFWMKTSGTTNAVIISNRLHTGNTAGWEVVQPTADPSKIQVNIVNTSATNLIAKRSSISVNTGEWVHVAFTYDGSSSASGVNIYINGALDSSPTVVYDNLSASIQNTNDLLMGNRNNGTGVYYTGILDDMRVYNYVRSASQVLEDMNYTPNPTGDFPIAWWRFEDGGQIKETNLWAEDNDGDKWTMSLESEHRAQTNTPGTGWVRRKDIIGSIWGDGNDGSVTFTTNTNLSTWNPAGRTCADGGEAVSYNLTAIGTNYALPNDQLGTIATASATISSGCLLADDNVLLINAQGTSTAYDNTGNYELMKVYSVSGNTVIFTTQKTKYYGDGASDDTNIGTATTNQRVIMQRVPQFNNVTINSGVTLSATAWNGSKGGILAFQVRGTLTNAGTISAAELGFRGGTTPGGWYGGYGGETYNGYAAKGYDGGSASGGGGGGTRASGVTTVTGTVGGGGGGGGARWGGGGGAGYATVGSGGSGASGYAGASGSGVNGGNGGSGANNVGGGGGGGGTYGDANLTKIYFGSASGGGGNSGTPDGCWDPGTIAGRGGGIAFIMARTLINTGTISAKGQASTGSPCASSPPGTGGSVKIFSKTATLGTINSTSGDGSGASVGRIAIGVNSSDAGSSSPAYTTITKP